MKKVFTKIFAVVFIFTLIFSSISIQADEPLYEKYEYQENFEYEDEIIGHALKAAVPKIMLEYSARVRYRPMKVDVDSLAEQVNIWSQQLAEAGYSEEEISEILVKEIEKVLPRYTTYGPYKEESANASGHGSGVVLSEDGYIATNAHVVELDDQTKLMLYMNSLSSSVAGDLRVMLQDAARYGVTFSDADIEYLYEQLLLKSCENAQVSNEKTSLTAYFASPDGDTSIDKANKFDAELIEIGTQDGVEGLTQDTAIIKIKAKNLVALPLSDTYPEYNSKIVSAGYPAVAEALFEMAGSEASSLSVSIGTGQIARIVPIDGSDFKALEITTTISGGNSGGPSVDTNLNIEGLNTYGPSEDQRYAYMISAEFVNSLLKDVEVGLGDTSKTFLMGLQLLQQDYGPAALKCFEEVKDAQKNIPYIEHMIEYAKKAPDNEHPADLEEESESEGFWGTIVSSPLYLGIFIGGCVLVLAIIILTIVLICSNSKKKKAKAKATAYSHSYVPSAPTTPITPITPPAPAMVDDTLINHNPAPEFAGQNNIQQNAPVQNFYANPQETAQNAAPSFDMNQEYGAPQAEDTGSRLKSTMKSPSSDDLL